MTSQLSLIRFHPLFWVMAGAAVLTGLFYDIMLLFLVVLLHELGHAAAALFFKWKVEKIELLPFGGVMKTSEHGNRPIREEVIVAISGPLVHLPLIVLSFFLLEAPFWHQADHDLFLHYNVVLLVFNLLPILPLDGGKLLYIWFTCRYSFHQAQQKMWQTSCIFLGAFMMALLLFFPHHLQAWFVLLFFILEHYTAHKQRPYHFFRFLLERTNMLGKQPGRSRPSFTEEISLYSRPMDAAKKIRKNQTAAFYVKENGQILPESFILETITKKRLGMVPFNDFLCKDKEQFL